MPKAAITWILVGAPNSGKTSLFNALTGEQAEVMNYPGSTAVTHSARLKTLSLAHINVVDTPGVYGLNGDTIEEQEVNKALSKHKKASVIFVMDMRFAEHRLNLLKDLLAKGYKCVVYCTNLASAQTSLDELHGEYGVSFIDSELPLAQKNLVYALDNIHLNHTRAAIPTPHSRRNINLDWLFLHPVLGIMATILLMTLMFSAVFFLAYPLSYQIELLMDQALRMAAQLNQSHALLGSMLSGIILGIGTLIMFTPQIFLLFFIILFIQESGYLARAAVILDPVMQRFGLHGKSFVSLLSGFSCAIPAILLTRTIESPKERLLTILAVPFTVCSARVPMYTLCVSFLFNHQSPLVAGLAFSGLYFLSLVMGLVAAGIIQRYLPGDQASYFMMELPPYRLPSVILVVRSALYRVRQFITNAGPLIAGLSLVVWFTTTFPDYENPNTKARLEHSYAGQFGQLIEPVFKPMGANWQVGTAILSSFGAREVFVSSLSMLLGEDLTETTEKTLFESLQDIKQDNGEKLFSTPSIIALLVFFMIALQCLSTTAITAKETNSWKIAILQFTVMNGLAYGLSVLTYQLLLRGLS